ncbi:MAG: molybdate ABC transporter substrate-binding protein [Desulfuromonadaceae bacterium]
MKIIFVTGVIILSMFCSSMGWADDVLLVFAGAGMRMPLEAIGEQFEAEYGTKVVCDFEGSGRLGSKILAGQRPDVFVPGAEKWAKLLKDKGYVKRYSPIAKHIPVILTPLNNTKVGTLRDFMQKDVRLVLGDPKACAIGRVGQRVFAKAGLNEVEMNVVARGATVKQLVRWIEFNNADATIAWRADGFQSNKVAMIPLPEAFTAGDTIPVCEMTRPTHPEAANRYIAYLLRHGAYLFAQFGFSVLE